MVPCGSHVGQPACIATTTTKTPPPPAPPPSSSSPPMHHQQLRLQRHLPHDTTTTTTTTTPTTTNDADINLTNENWRRRKTKKKRDTTTCNMLLSLILIVVSSNVIYDFLSFHYLPAPSEYLQQRQYTAANIMCLLPAGPIRLAQALLVQIEPTNNVNGNQFFDTADTEPTSALRQSFDREPRDRLADLGDNITLPCRINNRMGTVQWTRDGFGLGLDDRDLIKGFPRYRLNEDTNGENDYSLIIQNVQLEDDAIFQCQVSADSGHRAMPIASRLANLTVRVRPQKPEIFFTDGNSPLNKPIKVSFTNQTRTILDVKVGSNVQLNCTANGGRPAAEVRWFEGKSGQPMDLNYSIGYEFQEVKANRSKLINSGSVWRFQTRRNQHGRIYICSSTHPAQSRLEELLVQLNVLFEPEINITFNSSSSSPPPPPPSPSSPLFDIDDNYAVATTTSNHIESPHVYEYQNITFNCRVESNPPPIEYHWYHNSNGALLSETGVNYQLLNVSRQMNDDEIRCSARNTVGTTAASTRLSIGFAPTLTLSSVITLNPLHKNPLLSHKNNSSHSNVAARHSKQQQQSRQSYNVRYKDRLVYRLNENESIKLICDVESNPQAQPIGWFRLHTNYHELHNVSSLESNELIRSGVMGGSTVAPSNHQGEVTSNAQYSASGSNNATKQQVGGVDENENEAPLIDHETMSDWLLQEIQAKYRYISAQEQRQRRLQLNRDAINKTSNGVGGIISTKLAPLDNGNNATTDDKFNGDKLIMLMRDSVTITVLGGPTSHKVRTELSLSHVNNSAKYVCRAQAQGYKPVAVGTFVVLRQAPEILSRAQQSMAISSSRLQIECLARTTTEEQHQFSWLRKDKRAQPIEITAGSKYVLIDERSPDHLFQRSILVISKATIEDFGTYQCRVENSIGADELTIQVKPISPTTIVPLLVISLILGSAIIIISFVVLLLLCNSTISAFMAQQRRNNNNSDSGNTNNNTNNDRNSQTGKSTTLDIKMATDDSNDEQQTEVRTRSKLLLIARLIQGRNDKKTSAGQNSKQLHHTVILRQQHIQPANSGLNVAFILQHQLPQSQQQASPGISIGEKNDNDSNELPSNADADHQCPFAVIQQNLERTLHLQPPAAMRNTDNNDNIILNDELQVTTVNSENPTQTMIDDINDNKPAAANTNLSKLFSRLVRCKQTSLSSSSLDGARGAQKEFNPSGVTRPSPIAASLLGPIADNTTTDSITSSSSVPMIDRDRIVKNSCQNLLQSTGYFSAATGTFSADRGLGSSCVSSSDRASSQHGATEVCMIDSNGRLLISSNGGFQVSKQAMDQPPNQRHVAGMMFDNIDNEYKASSAYWPASQLINDQNATSAAWNAESEQQQQQQQQQQNYQQPNSLLMMTSQQDHNNPAMNTSQCVPNNSMADQIYISQIYHQQDVGNALATDANHQLSSVHYPYQHLIEPQDSVVNQVSYQPVGYHYQQQQQQQYNGDNNSAFTYGVDAYNQAAPIIEQYQNPMEPPLVVTSDSASDAFYESNYGTLISQSSAYRTLGYSKPAVDKHPFLRNQVANTRSQQRLSSTSTISMLGLDDTNAASTLNDDVFVTNNSHNTLMNSNTFYDDDSSNNNNNNNHHNRCKSLSHGGSASLSSNNSSSSNNNSDNNDIHYHDTNNTNCTRTYNGDNNKMSIMMNQPRIFHHLPNGAASTRATTLFNAKDNIIMDSTRGQLPLATHV